MNARLAIVLALSFVSVIAHGQRYTFYDENAREVPTKEQSYYYQEITSLGNGECLILEFYTSDNSKKKEAECREEQGIRLSFGLNPAIQSSDGKSHVLHGIEKNYLEGGEPWYAMIWGGRNGYRFAQYWIDGKPQLVNGSGLVKVGSDSGTLQVAEFRDSTILWQVEIDQLTKDSIYIQVEEEAYYSDDYDKLQRDFDDALNSVDKGSETGSVYVSFTIDKQGSVNALEVEGGGIGPVTTKLIENKFPSLGKWTPAKVRGKAVKSHHTTLLYVQ